MKVAIDARFYGPEGTGIGRYVEKLIKNLEAIDSKNDYFIILRKANFSLLDLKNPNFQKVLADASWYSVKEQLVVPAVLARIKPDLVHFPHFNIPLLYPGKFVVTIHDITKSEFKSSAATTRSNLVFTLKHSIYEFTIRQAVKRARKIFVPSKSTKGKIAKRFGLPKGKIVVTYEAADGGYVSFANLKVSNENKKQITAKYGLKEPFIIYIGNAFPYKNLEVVLKALKILKTKVYFVHASSKNTFVERTIQKAEQIGVGGMYLPVGFVPDEDLVQMLKLAEAFVFPSLSEGFGLPGVEAMASGCPVVCSDIEVLREVYGSAALYFDPKDPGDLVKNLNLVIQNDKLKTNLREKGLKQAKKYSWKKLAEQTLKVYNEFEVDGK